MSRPLHPLAPLILIVAFVVGACGSMEDPISDDEAINRHVEALVNGTMHYEHPAVGALVNGGSMCTATLVGKRTVLTAAHCIKPGYLHRFVVDNQYWRSASVHQHPSYAPPNTDYDVGVVLLQQDPSVKPAFISTKPPTKGQVLTLLGYGATSSQGGGSGTKRIGQNVVSYLTTSRIIISGSGGTIANLCFGDSGGPSFATFDNHEVQVGVHSTISGACGQQGHDMRVDVYADWIRTISKGDLAEDGKPSPFDDTEPPVVTITSPTPGAKLPNDLALEIKAEITDDNGVDQAELFVDGKYAASLSKAPYTFSLKLQPGEHTLKIVARDLVGNQAADVVKVTILPPLSFGELCDHNEACASGICATQGETIYCTQTCDPATSASCPDNAECLSAGSTFVCSAPQMGLDQAGSDDSSGCAVSSGAGSTLPTGLLLLGLLFVARRRRR